MGNVGWGVAILMAGCWTSMGCSAPRENPHVLLSKVDHLVYGTRDLEATIEHLEDVLGVRAEYGGQHPGHGTRNAILALGPATYLEILGPDPEQPEPVGPRWLGLDDLEASSIVAWAARGQNLESIVSEAAQADIILGDVLSGSRVRPDGSVLSWRVTDQVIADGVVPFFIDWGKTSHPARSAPQGLTLVGLRAEHPDAKQVRRQLDRLGLILSVTEGPSPALIATIRTASGLVELK